MCLRHHLHDSRKQGIGADFFGPHDQGARSVHCAAHHLVVGLLFDRHRLTGHHGLIDRAVAIDHNAVDRHFFAGANAQAIARYDHFYRHVFLVARLRHPPRGLWRQAEQGLDRRTGLTASPQFQDLAQQDQGHDDRRRFEIHGDVTGIIAKRGRKQIRQQDGNNAIHVGDADAQADQREHIEMTGHDRSPSTYKKRPRPPQHHRAGQKQFDPRTNRDGQDCAHGFSGEQVAHGDEKDRDCE